MASNFEMKMQIDHILEISFRLQWVRMSTHGVRYNVVFITH